jgi:outer membrane receptor protein involved in Fe transport
MSPRRDSTLSNASPRPYLIANSRWGIASASGLAMTAVVAVMLFLPGPALADARQEARRNFRNGMDQIAQGNFDQGIASLRRAYAIKPHPAVLYNIGKAYEDSKRLPLAAEYYRRYISYDPPDRDEVEAHLNELEARIAPPQPPQPPPPQPAPVPEPKVTGKPNLAAEEEKISALIARLETAVAKAERAAEPPSPRPAPTLEATPANPQQTPANAHPTEAETPEQAVGAYEEVVVTASRRAQTTLEAPVATTVITDEEIRLSGATNIPELLRRVPGMDVMAMGVASYDVSNRGFNNRLSNKVLVLVDGRSVYEDFLGFTLWPMLPIEMDEIERIEVVRGPGSALYGANAFAAVVNIITREPGTGPANQVSLAAGNGNTLRGSYVSSGRVDNLRYRASVGYEQADKWSVDYSPDRTDVASGVANPNLGLQAEHANGVVSYTFSRDFDLAASGGVTQLFSEVYPPGTLRNFFIDGTETYTKLDLHLGPVKLRSFWNYLDTTAGPQYWPANLPSITDKVDSNVVDVEGQFDQAFSFFGSHHFTAGGSWRLKRIDWNFIPDQLRIQNHFSLFVQDEYRPIDPLHIIVSYRVDRDPLIDNGQPGYAQSPRASLVYVLAQGHALHASIGTSFREPTFEESYLQLPVPLGTPDGAELIANGNPNLKPESLFAIELGYTGELDRINWDVNLYRNVVQNLIVISPIILSPGQNDYNASNASYVIGTTEFVNDPPVYTAYGAEVGSRISPIDGLDVRANLALEKIFASGLPSNEECAPCSEEPFWKFYVAASYRLKGGLDVAADFAYVDGTTWIESEPSTSTPSVNAYTSFPLSAYVVLDARASYHLIPDRLEISVTGTNLVGDYKEHPFGNLVDRRVLVSISANL